MALTRLKSLLVNSTFKPSPGADPLGDVSARSMARTLPKGGLIKRGREGRTPDAADRARNLDRTIQIK